ncbi:hypothetical protein G3N58_17510 [Paraburkholderia sp. Ac-20342]|uniref:hypothetical protein n=1 Tax=Paraburkholderia sp. Ac-20342 TaxID=2703889 RepID=UPI0019810274|nr:hypothetical protein [Paraburkholderia sp. Ac-20342]MBN3848606.1 hypothetical protein [Paraburkholderia sp. Ac-20342]
MLKRLLSALLLLASLPAFAQFTPGQVLTAAQLNTQFATKLPIAGGTLTGPLTVPSLSIASAATFGSTFRSLQYTLTPGATQTQAYGGRVLVTSGPTDNAIVGAIVQDGTNGNSFPTGVTGYGMMNNAGNQAFGVFGQCDIGYSGGAAVAGTCSNEFDTFNYSGAPSTQLPPNMAFGTSQVNAIGLQIDAYGNYASSIGLMLGYSSQAFSTGIYLNPQSSTVNGILVDATSSNGPTTSAEIRNSGAGVNLNLLTAGTTTTANPVLQVMNSSRAVKASINQGGAATLTGLQLNEPSNSQYTLMVNAPSDSNGAVIALVGNGATTPNKYLRASSGNFQICNSAYSACPLSVSDAGNISTTGTGTMPLYGTTGTAVNAPHMVTGTVALASGTATVTLSGSAVFTSSSSYACTANDTTAAAAVKVGQTSGTSITFTGTSTDTVQFSCAGN